MATPKYETGQQMLYWGKRRPELYGREVTIAYVVECGCKHQTYAVDYTLADGTTGRIDQVLETSLRPV